MKINVFQDICIALQKKEKEEEKNMLLYVWLYTAKILICVKALHKSCKKNSQFAASKGKVNLSALLFSVHNGVVNTCIELSTQLYIIPEHFGHLGREANQVLRGCKKLPW